MTSLTNDRLGRRWLPAAECEVVRTAVTRSSPITKLITVAQRVPDGPTAVIYATGATVTCGVGGRGSGIGGSEVRGSDVRDQRWEGQRSGLKES